MLASLHLSLSSILLLASTAITPIQAIAPTAPGPGDVFRAGSNCTISWSTDSEAQWGNFSIDLMTGSNTNMSIVMPVIQGLVGKDPDTTPYNWTCPEVDPYSAIYFYQFTADTGDNVLKQWTTRFTLASSTGDSEPPAKSTQPGGDQIPWGIGHLVGGTKDLGNTSSTNSSTSTLSTTHNS
ncbi:hypothetical protein OF83DRAFT_1056419 [Amylostereum chailletii]|nr:hypothetical protein OF83DRAFT_1056419 [Amylostereum chailletii]